MSNSSLKYVISFLVVGLLVACGGKKSTSGDPVAELAKLKDERAAIETKITALEKELETKGLIEKSFARLL